jgi:hypothetical protein
MSQSSAVAMRNYRRPVLVWHWKDDFTELPGLSMAPRIGVMGG